MLMEPQATIRRRQTAARLWLEAYAEQIRNGDSRAEAAIDRALMVILLTLRTSDYLAEHDPQALKQAQTALSGTSWEDHIASVQAPDHKHPGRGCRYLGNGIWNCGVTDQS
jgi:hypothetical protein